MRLVNEILNDPIQYEIVDDLKPRQIRIFREGTSWILYGGGTFPMDELVAVGYLYQIKKTTTYEIG
jgi:hypothetical protein